MKQKKTPSGYFVCVCVLGEIKNLPGKSRRSALPCSKFWHNFKLESAGAQSNGSTQTNLRGLHTAKKHAKEAEHRRRKSNETKVTTVGAAVEGSWTSGKLGIIEARQGERKKEKEEERKWIEWRLRAREAGGRGESSPSPLPSPPLILFSQRFCSDASQRSGRGKSAPCSHSSLQMSLGCTQMNSSQSSYLTPTRRERTVGEGGKKKKSRAKLSRSLEFKCGAEAKVERKCLRTLVCAPHQRWLYRNVESPQLNSWMMTSGRSNIFL